jgi:hypothetical protein
VGEVAHDARGGGDRVEEIVLGRRDGVELYAGALTRRVGTRRPLPEGRGEEVDTGVPRLRSG